MKKAAAFVSLWWPFAALFFFFFWPLLILRDSFVRYDYALQHLPWAVHAYESARQGLYPVWTNAMALGFPLFAEGQCASLYFLNWIGFRTLPFFAVYTWSIPLHFLAGAAGLYLYARKLGASPRAAVIASAAFCFSSAYAGCFYNTGSLRTLSWLPLELWLCQKLREPGMGLKATAGLAFLVCQQWLAGFPQMAVYAFGYLLLHELLAFRARSLLCLIAALAAGALAAWPQTSATLELIRESVRSSESASFALWGSVPPPAAVSLIFPEWGNALRVSFYLGMAPLFLALAPFFFEKRKGIARQAWLAAAFFALALGRFNPVYAWTVEALHLTALRNPAKFLFFVSVPLSVLAAFGFDALVSGGERGRRRFARASSLLAGAVCALPFAGLLLKAAAGSFWPGFSRWYVARLVAEKGVSAKDPSVYLAQMDAFFASLKELFSYTNHHTIRAIVLALAIAALIRLLSRNRLTPAKFYASVGALTVWDLAVFGLTLGAGFVGNAGPIRSLEPTPAMQRVLKVVHQDPGLFAELVKDPNNEFFPPNSGILYDVKHAGGYSPLLLSRYHELVRALGIADSSLGRESFSEAVWQARRGVVDLAGIRYLHTDFPLGWPGLKLLDSDADFFLYENTQAVPAVTGHSVWRLMPDARERLAYLQGPDFTPSRETVIEDERLAAGLVPDPSAPSALCELLPGSRTDSLSLRIEMAADGIVRVRTAAYPGWRLEVDGKKSDWSRVDHAFIGFALKKGTHQVRLSYRRGGR